MSGNEGVVRSSALSFLTEQAQTQPNCSENVTATEQKSNHPQNDVVMPFGLEALCAATAQLYPLQPNPLQVTTRLKYWLGGNDPLDYISMYWNEGNAELDVPPHWHYVSFGLSDLHGDGRVHPPADRVLCASPAPPPSGYGLELTFRLKAVLGSPPPLWPAALLQHLARYIFTTGNKLCAGDHVSWHAALDGGAGAGGGRSRIRHLLVADDPQLPTIHTPLGTVSFLQMVGCTGRELRAAQRGSGTDVLERMAKDKLCGGAYLVTDSSRRRSTRGLRCAGGARSEDVAPAQLAGVSARIRWLPYDQSTEYQNRSTQHSLPHALQEQIRIALQRGLNEMASSGGGSKSERVGASVTHMSIDSAPGSVLASAESIGRNRPGVSDSFEMSSLERALPHEDYAGRDSSPGEGGAGGEEELVQLRGVHLQLNPEGASLIPLALLGRVAHSRHFTWRDAAGCHAVTLVGERVGGAFVTPKKPYAAKRGWLQMLIPSKVAVEMAERASFLASLADTDSESDSDEEESGKVKKEKQGICNTPPSAAHSLHWPELNIRLSVMPDHYFY